MPKPIRIQKALTDSGILSRRKTEEYIKAGRITVNGRPAQPGNPVNPDRDVVAIDGVRVPLSSKRENIYIMLNKPRGYVTTTSDELGRRCVTELVEDLGERVYPVGRLDKNSEGLLLMTNDGQFANLMMHPSHHVSKTYRVTVRPDITEDQVVALSTGVDIGEERKTLPAQVHVLEKVPGRVVLQITITEGRNRQIRRMCEAVGLEVARLKRMSVGPVRLGMLQPGKWRELKKSEVIALRNAARPAGQQEPLPQEDKGPHVASFGGTERRGARRKDHFVGKKESRTEALLRETDAYTRGGRSARQGKLSRASARPTGQGLRGGRGDGPKK